MGEATYVNANLYNKVVRCDICNDSGKTEFTKFIKHKESCTTSKRGVSKTKRFLSVFKGKPVERDTTLYVCQSCVSRAFRKYDSKV